MGQPRVTGQDTELFVIVDGEEVLNLSAIKSHDFTYKMKKTEEEYCGETAPRFDHFYMGIEGKVEFDIEGIESLELAQQIVDSARNRAAVVKFSIRTTISFPSGDRAIVNMKECAFGDLPFVFGGRSEYGKNTLTYSCSTARVVVR